MIEQAADRSVAVLSPEGGSYRRLRHSEIRNWRRPPANTPRMVVRDDLVASLDRATAHQVTIISAPAGSGKTSLLQAWANRPGRAHRVVSVSVRRDGPDARRFWLALLNAVRRAAGAIDTTEPPDLDLRTLAEKVLTQLAEVGGRVIVVIDDLHELNPPEALGHLLTSLPANARAVVATRHDLRLGLHHLRLVGELAEIRAADLRFTERETRELLDLSGVALSEASAALLHRRTEGWAAGLRLAALSLADHADPERFVAEFSGSARTVAAYLLAEVLDRQPDDVRDLLLRTSILDRVNSELADVLTGRPGSERILLGLEDANAFVESFDPTRTWFRYHQMFGDLLRLELRRTLSAEMPALHRRAAAWFGAHGQVVAAIRHCQAAGDWSDAARLLADHSFALTMDGQEPTIHALLRVFPSGADYPELAPVHAGRSITRGRLDDAAAHLAVAETCAEAALPARRQRLRVAITALKLSLATRRGRIAEVVELARLIGVPATGRSIEDIALHGALRAVAMMSRGTVEASLGLADAERHLREGAVLARKIGRPYLEVSCLAQLGFTSKIPLLAVDQQPCRTAITVAERHGWDAKWIIAPALLTLAGTMAWTGEFDEAERQLRRAVQTLRTDPEPDIQFRVDVVDGMVLAGRGRYRHALEKFAEAERLRSQLAGSHALADLVTGWMLVMQARLGRAADARATIAALSDERAGSGEIRNAGAAICLAEGDPEGALAAVRPVLDGTAPVIGYVTVVDAELLAAYAHRELGDERAANQATDRALGLAEPERLVLPFAIAGRRELIAALPPQQTADAVPLEVVRDAAPPAPRLVGKLSPSELKVLRYLPTNLSRLEIASQLSVSVNTVNTHIRRIYAKLGADRRSAAVRSARELRLLAAGNAFAGSR